MYSIIVGSMRKDSQSEKVANYLASQLVNIGHEIVGLRSLNLPLWMEENIVSETPWCSVSQKLCASTAFIFVTPEWDGMASPAIKNFIMYCRNKEFFHKPVLLVSVSAGNGGSYPIAELRMSSYKNSRICYLPEHVIVRQVETVLNESEPKQASDIFIRERINFSLNMLHAYSTAFSIIKQQLFLYDEKFQNGM